MDEYDLDDQHAPECFADMSALFRTVAAENQHFRAAPVSKRFIGPSRR